MINNFNQTRTNEDINEYNNFKEVINHSRIVKHKVKKIINKLYRRNEGNFHPFLISKHFNVRKKKSIQWFFKRLVDIIGASFGIIALFPFLFVIALMIKLDSNGPVIFKQNRIGLNGKKFDMYKFRTMCLNANEKLKELKEHNESNLVMFKMQNDPRITNIGRFLRKYSIDEFPQLLNVLKGEMSLVGPRPALLEEVDMYEDWHYVRLGTFPGLTGVWQVNGRANIKDFDTVVSMDFSYIQNWSLLLDIQLLFKTIPAVLLAKGAS